MKKLLLTFALLLWLPFAYANEAELERGLEAYDAEDYKTALAIWKPIAEQGHASSQFWLGVLYENGKGTLENYNEAIKWYNKAAEQGNARALSNLASMYKKGIGVSQDYKKAMELFRKAAVQGYEVAQGRLGLMYESAKDTEKNSIYAYMWLSIAKSNNIFKDRGETYQKALDFVERFMPSADVEKAQELAQRCLESNYKDCD